MVLVKETPSKVQESMINVLDIMRSGKLPQVVAITMFPKGNSPFSTWSLFNRMNCILSFQIQQQAKFFDKKGDFDIDAYIAAESKLDFRGYKQWMDVGRHVKVGQKSYAYILVPMFSKSIRKYWENNHGSKHFLNKDGTPPHGHSIKNEEYNYLRNFKGFPVFNVDQTKGKKLPTEDLKLPNFPFMAVADFLKIKVYAVEGNRKYYGSFSPTFNTIKLATAEEATFFHELAHAVDNYLLIKTGKKGLKGGQDTTQEIVADFSSAVICYICGLEPDMKIARTKQYIQHYTKIKDPSKNILKLFSRVESVVDFIVNFKEEKSEEVKLKKKKGTDLRPAEELADTPDKRTVEILEPDKNKSLKKEIDSKDRLKK